jgi:D-alanyl-D-alanine carboxypeptidase
VLVAFVVLAGCDAAGTAAESAQPGAAQPGPARPGAAPAAGRTTSPGAPAAAAASTPPSPALDLTAHSTTDPDSPWVIVNKAHPLDPIDDEPDDLLVVHGYLVRSIAADDLTALLDAASADGVTLTLRSAYRSYGRQRTVYDGWVRQLGQAEADRVSARPGYSEHQTGLAVDVGSATDSGCDFDDCFAGTIEGRWVAANAQRFGFVVRYTAANEQVTGYAPEAWHLRWVGRPLAAAMGAAGVTTLEEMFGVAGDTVYR